MKFPYLTYQSIYLSPEQLLGQEGTEKSDIYSYSIVLWELFAEKKPFQDYLKDFNAEKFIQHVNNNGRPSRREVLESCGVSVSNPPAHLQDFCKFLFFCSP